MELLERYLAAVKPMLPRKAQTDILRELSDEILSQMEDRAEELGRDLTDAEQAEVIRKNGHPVVVAARYGQARYLIGPEIFPVYWLILRIAAIGALLVRLMIAVITIVLSANPAREIIPALIAVPYVLVPVFCWVTGAFAFFGVCQSAFHTKWRLSWDPRSLPETGKHSVSVPRTHSVAEIVAGAVSLLWWQALPVAPFLALGPLAVVLGISSNWNTFHWPVVALIAATIAQAIANLARPDITPARIRVRLLLQAFGLTVLGMALRAGNWVVLSPGVPDPAKYVSLVHVTNEAVFYCLVIGLLICGVQFAIACIRHVRDFFSAMRRAAQPGRPPVLNQFWWRLSVTPAARANS